MVTCPWCGMHLGVEPGQKVQVILYNNRIEIIPVRPVRESRGFLKGVDTSVERETEGADFETIPGVKYIKKA